MVLLYARHAGRGLHVGERQLDKGFAIELVLLERERHVERGFVLGQVVSWRSAARQAIARKMRPSCLSAIFRCRSFSLRGPSMIHARAAKYRTRVAGARTAQSDVTPAATARR